MTLTDIQRRALLIVSVNPGIRASGLGWNLWGSTTAHPNRGEGSHGSNKFCRVAGKVLNALQRGGLVWEGTDEAGITWRVSPAGERALRENT